MMKLHPIMLIKMGGFRVAITYDFDIVIWKWFQHALMVCRNPFIYGCH